MKEISLANKPFGPRNGEYYKPTIEDVDDLIRGVDKVIKTIF